MSKAAPKPKPARKPRSRGWRLLIAIFKWTRVAILLALLSVIVLGLFLNSVGLPAWVHRRIVAQMKEQGWDMDFSRLRLRWYRGIVADHLQLSRTNAVTGPHLFVETAEFRLNSGALRSLNLQADSVLLAGGKLVWPLPGTNQPRKTFVLNRVRGELFFKPGDHWELRSLQAQSLGANVRIRGDLSHASSIRDWKLPKKEPKEPRATEDGFWREFLVQAGKIRTTAPPEIHVIFALDGRDPRQLDAQAKVNFLNVDSPWGAATNLSLTARFQPPTTSNDLAQAEVSLTAEHPHTPWGTALDLQLDARLAPSLTEPFPTNGTLKIEARIPRTPWGNAGRFMIEARTTPLASNVGSRLTMFTMSAEQPRIEQGHARFVRIEAQAIHAATNLLPAAIRSATTLEQAMTPWATSAWTRVETLFELPRKEDWLFARTNLTWPERMLNVPFDLTAAFSNANGAHLDFSHGSLTNQWRPPLFRVDGDCMSSAGALRLNSSLDTDTRASSFNATFRGDPHRLSPFLPTNALPWVADWQSGAPLEMQAAGQAVLPEWSNLQSDWLAQLLPTLSVASRLAAAEGAYREVRFSAARALCLYTNGVWMLPEIHIARPEGTVEGAATVDGGTGAFRCTLRSTIDPQALRPAFPARVQREVFDLFEFSTPPALDSEARGSLRDFSTFHATASGAVTNAAFRKESASFASATVEFTNGFLSIYHPIVLRDGERGEADGLGIHFPTQRLYFTNGYGNLNAMAVARAIGPPVVRAIEPYVFDKPPQVRVTGSIPLGRSDKSEDLRFELEGGPLHWWRIHTESTRASLHWLGDRLTISNVVARWCGGDTRGWATFDFSKPKGGAMACSADVKGGDLSRIVRDFQEGHTNRLEGTLDVELLVTQADVNDFDSWHGQGQARLRDGLIWDSPLFGAASKLLNAFIPGLGNSRAKQATNSFIMTNSVFYTKDLRIEATGMHLKYRGTVDFDGKLDARMEAQLLRGVPGLGPLFSTVLWPIGKIFEYRVSGTLADPKLDEVYFIPKLLLFPLQPIKTMKSLFGDGGKEARDKPAEPNLPTPP